MVYHLDRAELPTIPVPHDGIINNISLSDDFLILDFAEGISAYDSIQEICPNARTLTIKIHLTDTIDVYQMKIRKFPKYKRRYEELDFAELVRLAKQRRLEYLYHYLSYRALIVNLSCGTNVILSLQTDAIEYIWKM